jgi:hypothetical protein
MENDDRRTACVICAKPIEDAAPARLVVGSGQHSGRTYFVHPACLKRVAKQGFAGIKDL